MLHAKMRTERRPTTLAFLPKRAWNKTPSYKQKCRRKMNDTLLKIGLTLLSSSSSASFNSASKPTNSGAELYGKNVNYSDST